MQNQGSASAAANNVSTGIRAMFSNAINGFVADLSPDELEEISNNLPIFVYSKVRALV